MGVRGIRGWSRRSTAPGDWTYTTNRWECIPERRNMTISPSASVRSAVKWQNSLRTKVSRHYFAEIKGGKKSKTGTKNYVNETNGNAISFLWKRPVEKPVEIVEKCEFSTATPANSNSGTPEKRGLAERERK